MPINIFTTFDDPSATNGTQAFGINATGQIVGAYFDATGHHGFLFNPNGGTYTTLNDPSSATAGTVAQGINAAGQIVGTFFTGGVNSEGFLLSSGVYTTLDGPMHTGQTQAFGINATGQIVGTIVPPLASETFIGFLYSGGN
jgi:probable HAF family extracellular repeat protein